MAVGLIVVGESTARLRWLAAMSCCGCLSIDIGRGDRRRRLFVTARFYVRGMRWESLKYIPSTPAAFGNVIKMEDATALPGSFHLAISEEL